jgi:uncharacterized protein (TIGR00369 family)
MANGTAEVDGPRAARGITPVPLQNGLGMRFDISAERAVAWMPIEPSTCSSPGALRTGVLATLADGVAGMAALLAVDPGWTATTDLAVHRLGSARGVEAIATAHVVHRRQRGVVLEVEVVDELSTDLARVVTSFADLGPRDGAPPGFANACRLIVPGEPDLDPRPLGERFAATPLNDGIQVELRDDLRNMAEAMVGGATCCVAELAAESAVARSTGVDVEVSSLSVHFVGPGRVGPVQGRVTAWPGSGPGTTARVEVRDAGADHRLMAVAFAGMAPTRPM